MKWPLLGVTLFHLAGILLGARFPLPAGPGFALGLMLLMAAWKWGAQARWLMGLLMLFTGWLNLSWQSAAHSPHDLRPQLGSRTVLATLQGKIIQPPVERCQEENSRVTWSTRVLVDSRAVRLTGNWRPCQGKVLCHFPGRLPPEFRHGQRIQIGGVLHPPPAAIFPGLFDYADHLHRRGVHYQMETDFPSDWAVLPPELKRRPLGQMFQTWARKTLARGLPAEDETLHLLYAMVLGWRANLQGEVAEPFMHSGTMHVFAISGLHIALIAGILIQLSGFLRIPRQRCGLVVIPLLWIYVAATGWQPSATRATVMSSVIVAGWTLRRPSNALNSLCAAALILLLHDPRQLFQAGFQLSFAVVLSLCLIAPRLTAGKPPGHLEDPLLPATLRPRWQRWLASAWRWTVFSLAASGSAWIGSMPIIALYFNLVTPASVAANLAIVPLSALTLMSAMGSLMTGAWFPGAGILFNHAAWFWMTLIRRVSEWAAAIPGGYFHVTSPGAVVLILYYLALGLYFLWALEGARPLRRLAVFYPLLLAITGLVGFGALNRSTTEIAILPAFGGTVLFVDPPGTRHDLLIDCGGEYAVGRITLPFLKSRGRNRVRNLLLTHGDVRQVGGESLLSSKMPVDHHFTSAVPFRSEYYRTILGKLAETPDRHGAVSAGDSMRGWEVLWPPHPELFSRADDNTVVLFGEISGWRILLLSDLGRAGQNALMERYPDLRADLVITGLPSQDEPVRDALLRQLQPRVLIVGTSTRPASRYGSRSLRERLGSHAFPVLYTADTGGLRLQFRHRQVIIESSRARLWEGNAPSAPGKGAKDLHTSSLRNRDFAKRKARSNVTELRNSDRKGNATSQGNRGIGP